MPTRQGFSQQWWITISLIVLSAAYGALGAIAVSRGSIVSEYTSMLWLLVFTLLVMFWARLDRAAIPGKQYSSLLMFFFWPIVLAYHLITSRGIEGFILYLGFLALYLAPNYAMLVTWAVCCRHAS